jgi:alkyl hydroperoxide reductase subunit AhpC
MPSFEEKLSEFDRRNAQVLGISCDLQFSTEEWAKQLGGLSYPLLSDFWPHGKTCIDYGVLRPGGFSERAVFVIDRSGVIRYVDIHDIGSAPAVEPILEALDKLV